ncbi:hypothetical protein BJ138DRAFT_1104584 [Hygrophoropsis aurantiaca]|uniref:Uncharacterized protein n=1 Tax=Hygrophoropsis aurantiaca TaxID=72124 RepID=A0ACB8A102_9AGAM|nr:hypothetical protein BJ138DRAFT_1104584 [Hygrophoropsis aurantiaca]
MSVETDLNGYSSPPGSKARAVMQEVGEQAVSKSRGVSSHAGVSSQQVSQHRSRRKLTLCVREAGERVVSKSVKIDLDMHSQAGCEKRGRVVSKSVEINLGEHLRSKWGSGWSSSQSRTIFMGTHTLWVQEAGERTVSESVEINLDGHSLSVCEKRGYRVVSKSIDSNVARHSHAKRKKHGSRWSARLTSWVREEWEQVVSKSVKIHLGKHSLSVCKKRAVSSHSRLILTGTPHLLGAKSGGPIGQ